MGTPGVPLNIPKDVIVETLRREKGRITHTSKALGISPTALYKQLEKMDLYDLLAELRNDYDAALLDGSEDVLTYALSQAEKDLTNAMKATTYILNNKGRKRGYFPPTYKEPQEGTNDEVLSAVAGINEDPRDPASSEPRMATQPPVLDQRPSGKAHSVSAKLGTEDSDFGLPPV